MGDVVRVADFQKRDTVGLLRELLVRASRGEVMALAFHAEMKNGTQKTGFTGRFKNNVEEALRVANRMSLALNNIKDAQDAAALVRDYEICDLDRRRAAGGLCQQHPGGLPL